MRLLLATRNRHKADEFSQLLAPYGVDPLPDEVVLPPETGTTFTENALGKARAAAAALDGAPGVYSARFAGPDATDEENLAKLVRLAPAGSPLAYVCAIAVVDPTVDPGHPVEHVVIGRCTGHVADRPRGTGGFGYDPAFVPDEHPASTMAELTPAEKHAISHRGRAAAELLQWLRS